MLSLCMLCMLMLVIFPAIAADRISGVIINFRGMAHIVHGDSRQTVKRGLRVMVGDQILTGDNARVAIKMIDDAILILGSNTQFHIRQYNYASQARQGSASLELLKGALRSITGLIGKTSGKDFKIKTAVATIGIRGTDFWVGTIFGNATDAALFSGEAIYVENDAGRVEIDQAGFGTTVEAINTPPSPPRQWGKTKYQAAQSSVSLIADDPALQQESDDY